MRVCLATGQFATPYSGVGTYAKALATGLRRQGIQLVILCPPEQAEPGAGFEFVATPIMRLPGHARWLSHAHAFTRGLRDVSDVDLIHFLDAREAVWYAGRGAATVGSVHDYYFIDPMQYVRHRQRYPDWPLRASYALLARAMERAAYRRLDALIVNSEATNVRISSAYRLAGRLTTIHIGLDLLIPHPLHADRVDSVLFVGGNAYRKGLDRLIRCVPDLVPPHTELWVAGTRMPRRLSALALSYGAGPRVKHYGTIHGDALAALYRRAKVVALPGVTEAFGLVFMEAMAAGCAVLGPADGGASELIEDGVSGYLVPYDDDRLLRERLNTLLNDEGLRQRMAEAAARSLSGRTADRMTLETVKVYRSLLANRPSEHEEKRAP